MAKVIPYWSYQYRYRLKLTCNQKITSLPPVWCFIGPNTSESALYDHFGRSRIWPYSDIITTFSILFRNFYQFFVSVMQFDSGNCTTCILILSTYIHFIMLMKYMMNLMFCFHFEPNCTNPGLVKQYHTVAVSVVVTIWIL